MARWHWCWSHFRYAPGLGSWCTPIWWRSKLTTFEALSNKLVQNCRALTLESKLQSVRNKSETLTQKANFPIQIATVLCMFPQFIYIREREILRKALLYQLLFSKI